MWLYWVDDGVDQSGLEVVDVTRDADLRRHLENSREAAAGSDWAGPTASHDAPWVLRPKWLRHAAGQAAGR